MPVILITQRPHQQQQPRRRQRANKQAPWNTIDLGELNWPIDEDENENDDGDGNGDDDEDEDEDEEADDGDEGSKVATLNVLTVWLTTHSLVPMAWMSVWPSGH